MKLFSNHGIVRNWATDANNIFLAAKGELPGVQPIATISIRKDGEYFAVRIQDVTEDILVDTKEFHGFPLEWVWGVTLAGTVFAVPDWDDGIISNSWEILD